MALCLLMLPTLLTAMAVSGQDGLPFNTTGLTEIYVQQVGSNLRHGFIRPTGTSCNRRTFLSPGQSCVFTSPNFPRPYSRGISKIWFKSLNRSCNIKIECSEFQLPSAFFCSHSTNLFVKWGSGLKEWKCFCGSNIPPAVVSSNYWAYAKFSSYQKRNRSYRGFNCTASTICPTTTAAPTTIAPTTAAPTIIASTAISPTTAPPTTAIPTTVITTTTVPTTFAVTITAQTTAAPTMDDTSTPNPTTVDATTTVPTTAGPTASALTTA